jgi:hypothetical protein
MKLEVVVVPVSDVDRTMTNARERRYERTR